MQEYLVFFRRPSPLVFVVISFNGKKLDFCPIATFDAIFFGLQCSTDLVVTHEIRPHIIHKRTAAAIIIH